MGRYKFGSTDYGPPLRRPPKTANGVGPSGARLKIMRPELRACFVEVLKATVVYHGLLHPDEALFARIEQSNYAIAGDDMLITQDALVKYKALVQKLNLKISL